MEKINPYIEITEIPIPIYNGMLVVLLSNSKKKIKKVLPKFKSDPYAHAISTNWKGLDGYVVILNFDSGYAIRPGTIAHEAGHIANMIGESRGFLPTLINDEPMAYLIGWVADQVHDVIREAGKITLTNKEVEKLNSIKDTE